MNDLFSGPVFNTLNRRAAFIAQLAVESAGFHAVVENLMYSGNGLLHTFPKYFDASIVNQYEYQPAKIASRVYANRMGNRDETSGDGFKYRGRGFIQLTGHDNYVACGHDIGVDLITNPDYLSTVVGAFASAVWYWNKHNLNQYADADDIKTITHVINGGYNALPERTLFYTKAKTILT